MCGSLDRFLGTRVGLDGYVVQTVHHGIVDGAGSVQEFFSDLLKVFFGGRIHWWVWIEFHHLSFCAIRWRRVLRWYMLGSRWFRILEL